MSTVEQIEQALANAKGNLAPAPAADPFRVEVETLVKTAAHEIRLGQLTGGEFPGLDVVLFDDGTSETAFWFVRGPESRFQVALGFDDVNKAWREAERCEMGDLNAVVPMAMEQTLALLDGGSVEAMQAFCQFYEKAREQADYQPRVISPGEEHFCKALNGLEKVAADDNGDLRLVTGIVLEPDIADSQSDTYTADEIRKTAHLWLLDYQNIGLQHKAIVNHQVSPVESWLAPVDFDFPMADGTTVAIKAGTWLLTVKVFDDDMWEDVKKGVLTGFSIAGFARRIPLDNSAE